MARILAAYRILAALGVLLGCLGAAYWIVPAGRAAFDLVLAQDDAARLADLRLAQVLTPERVAAEIRDSLDEEDFEMARSFLALADARSIPVDAALRVRAQAGPGAAEQALNGAGRFGLGFVTGRADDLAGLAGAAAGDLTVWGDLRDAGREAVHWVKGEEVDKLILGLSAAGIAVTGVSYATLGASLPARAGLSLLKGARRAGALGVRFADDLAGLLRRGAKGPVLRLAADLGTVQAKAGTRATLAGLRHVDGAKDATRLARLADANGAKTLAVLKTLGRGALFLGEALAKLAFWVIGAAVNVIGMVAAFNRLVVEMARPLWRRRSCASASFESPPAPYVG